MIKKERPFTDSVKCWFVYNALYIFSCPHALLSADQGFNSSPKWGIVFRTLVAFYITVTCVINSLARLLYTSNLCKSKVPQARSIIRPIEDIIPQVNLSISRTRMLCSAMGQSCLQWWCQWVRFKALTWLMLLERVVQSIITSLHPMLAQGREASGSPGLPHWCPAHSRLLHRALCYQSFKKHIGFRRRTDFKLKNIL